MNTSLNYRPWLFWLAVAVAGMCLLMISAGGMVTSMDAGDAVPDWPLSYGSLMPPMVGNVFWEHGHRLVGMALGLATIVLTVTFARSEPRKWVRMLGYVALPAVCFQGLLGGFRVKLISSPWVQDQLFGDPTGAQVETFRVGLMMVHTTMAQCVLCLFAVIALVTSRHWLLAETGEGGQSEDLFCRACGYNLRGLPQRGSSQHWQGTENGQVTENGQGTEVVCPECGMQDTGTPIAQAVGRIPKLAIVTSIVIVLQLLMGALRRHTDGTIIYHAIGAFAVAVHVLALSRRVFMNFRLQRAMRAFAVTLLVTLSLQLALGLGSWLLTSAAIASGIAPNINGSTEWASALISMHVAVGAVMLATTVLMIVEGRRIAQGGRTASPVSTDALRGTDPRGVVTA